MTARKAGLALLLVAAGGPASGATVDATSTTLLIARPELRAGEVRTGAPLVQQVGLTARGLEASWADDVRLHVVAWGRLNATALGEHGGLGGDVDLAFAQGRLLQRRLLLRAGRQLVFSGGARVSYLDGVHADARLWRGVGLSAFGGAPVRASFAVQRGDWVMGTRLYWAPSVNAEVGASFTYGLDGGELSRQDLGLDARYVPMPGLSLSGYSLWSTAEARLAQLDVGPRWQPLPDVEVSAAYRRTAPDLLLPRHSIFTVFAEEARDELGAGASWQATERVGVYADYRAILVSDGLGSDVGGRVSVRLGPFARTIVSGQLRLLRVPLNGYVRARVSAIHRLPADLSLALEADSYLLDRPVNGQRQSLTGLASLNYDIAPGWRAGLTGIGSTTPSFESRFDVLAKLTYQLTHLTRGSGGAD